MKRKAPTTEEIDKALKAAAFGDVGQYDLSFFVLGRALNFAAWRKQRTGGGEE